MCLFLVISFTNVTILLCSLSLVILLWPYPIHCTMLEKINLLPFPFLEWNTPWLKKCFVFFGSPFSLHISFVD